MSTNRAVRPLTAPIPIKSAPQTPAQAPPPQHGSSVAADVPPNTSRHRPVQSIMATPQPSGTGQRQGRLTRRELEAGRRRAEEEYHEAEAIHERWCGVGVDKEGAAEFLRAQRTMLPELESKMATAAAAMREWLPNDRVKVRRRAVRKSTGTLQVCLCLPRSAYLISSHLSPSHHPNIAGNYTRDVGRVIWPPYETPTRAVAVPRVAGRAQAFHRRGRCPHVRM